MEALVTLLAILSPVLAIILYFKSRRFKRLSYSTSSVIVIEDYVTKIPGLAISFSGQKVKNLSISRVLVWNSGPLTIESNDFTADTLRCYVGEDGEVLNVRIIERTTDANMFSARATQSDCALQFDYLDPGDGAVVEVVHTGDRYNTLTLRGTLKGARFAGRVARDRLISKREHHNVLLTVSAIPMLLVSMTLVVLTVAQTPLGRQLGVDTFFELTEPVPLTLSFVLGNIVFGLLLALLAGAGALCWLHIARTVAPLSLTAFGKEDVFQTDT